MGMLAGGDRGQKADINMTPMIDVLLVLIIIFMVITPTVSRGLDALVPQSPDQQQPTPPPVHDVVITVQADRTLLLNQEPVALAALRDRLARLFQSSPHRVIFVRGAKELEFQAVAEVIDIAHDAGIDRVALMTN